MGYLYNLDELRNTCVKHGIKMVLLYGSQAMGNSNEKSDVDLGLLLKDDSYDFEDIIKDLMKVFNGDIIDVAILNHGDPVLKFEIISNYKILFCEEDEIFLEFYLNTVKQYNDTKKFRILEKVYLENFIRGERDGIHKCNPPKVNKSF
ncbi:type VII toxin-antitoxin system MntA family adenylyltransferase antitoxin [Clostridium estertheticum]|uniref:type VII toxin-antitoxin system MntA family adenylyltransferase antitoxin n=1 Tax=Clostridium estertheticum TaxID=238834 RepID=UPI001CF4CBA3|nr:nucleotidyltransferase domain-containing protein [Clostridium estertheticum]MCB2360175.1 nucleotidyltransferase domain-containing protein [Clostridium estertheticum]